MNRLLVLAVVPLLLANDGGCSSRKPPSPQTVVIRPADPPECLEGPLAEPRLPDADITDDVAARDRDALKRWGRASEAKRHICRAALERRNRRD
jgi:hypothetical protein